MVGGGVARGVVHRTPHDRGGMVHYAPIRRPHVVHRAPWGAPTWCMVHHMQSTRRGAALYLVGPPSPGVGIGVIFGYMCVLNSYLCA